MEGFKDHDMLSFTLIISPHPKIFYSFWLFPFSKMRLSAS